MTFKFSATLAAAAVALSVSAAPSFAQTAPAQSLGQLCFEQPLSCESYILAYVNNLVASGVSGESLDNLLAQAVAEVYSAASATPVGAGTSSYFAESISLATSYMSSPTLRESLNEVATIVANNEAANTPITAVGLTPPPTPIDTTGTIASNN